MRRALGAVAVWPGWVALPCSPPSRARPWPAPRPRPRRQLRTGGDQSRFRRAAASAIRPVSSGCRSSTTSWTPTSAPGSCSIASSAMLQPGGGARLPSIGGKSADHMMLEHPMEAAQEVSAPTGCSSWRSGLARAAGRPGATGAPAGDPRSQPGCALALDGGQLRRRRAQGSTAGSLAGLEIGNEPDMYHFQPRLTARTASPPRRCTTPRHWWSNYTNVSYKLGLRRLRPRPARSGAPDHSGRA